MYCNVFHIVSHFFCFEIFYFNEKSNESSDFSHARIGKGIVHCCFKKIELIFEFRLCLLTFLMCFHSENLMKKFIGILLRHE